MKHCLRSLLVLLLLTGLAFAGNWPRFRGPAGDGHSPEKDLPLKWSPTENVRWKTPLSQPGNSSPIVWGDRIFLTQANKDGTVRSVLCFDRANGKLLWQKDTEFEEKEKTHGTNPFCAATPVTDGERVIASLASAGLVCYDFAGKELWRYDLGPLEHIWGTASSPILHGDLCILWAGPGDRQFLVAVNKKDGKKVWQTDIPGGQKGVDNKGDTWVGSWSTPIIVKAGEREEMLLGVPDHLKAFDPRTGKELWSCDGLSKLVYTSPLFSSDGVVVAMSGFHGPDLAVKAGGNGDVTKSRLWRHADKISQRIGSGVIVGEHVYMVNEDGTAQCIELKTGNDLWNKERLGQNPAWSSIVAAGDRLYLTTNKGETLVLAAKPKLDILAKNPLGEEVRATLAVSDGEIFIRTYKNLWSISEKKK